MDIHPPSHPIRSIRDFFLHIFTITVGILIALGLDQLVEARRTDTLTAHARQAFAQEIDWNRHQLDDGLAGEDAREKALQAWIDYGEARRRHESPTMPSLAVLQTRRFPRLASSAWESAVATQAVAKLGFGEVQALSQAYTRQKTLQTLEEHAIEQWIGIAGFGDPQTMADPEWNDAVHVLRVALAYARSIAANGALLETDYTHAEAALREAGRANAGAQAGPKGT